MPAFNYSNNNSLVNEEVKEVLGAPPARITRIGNVLVFVLLAVFLVLAFWVRFPDILHGQAVVTPRQAPVPVVVSAQSAVRNLAVTDGAIIRRGQTLLYYIGEGRRSADSLSATEGGTVFIQRTITPGETIGEDSLVMTIVPENEAYKAVVSLPAAGSGKIHPGQQVLIYLDNYPSREFGTLTGTVLTRPAYNGSNNAVVTVKFNGNSTSYKKQLSIISALQGHAEIITDNKKLISHLFGF